MRSGSLRWEAASGQMMLALDADRSSVVYRFEDLATWGGATDRSVDSRFAEAEGLEDVDPIAAERAYKPCCGMTPATLTRT